MSPGKKTFVEHDVDQQQILIMSSTQFIDQSLKYVLDKKLNPDKKKAWRYFAEILHSILFIGFINFPRIEPEDILPESTVTRLKEKMPDVFEKYRSCLPTRTPFSILLDWVVHTAGDNVMKTLLDLNEKMHIPKTNGMCGNDFCLASTVVSYCYFEDKKENKIPRKYYGASVACTGKAKRDFFINLSCVQTWNRKVALGVCLAAKGNKSILLPKTVHSAAFTMLNDQRDEDRAENSDHIGSGSDQRYERSPCEKCWEIFPGVVFSPPECDKKEANWKHGNCAECEAISNLLNGEGAVDKGVKLGDQLLTTADAIKKLEPLLKPRIENMKNTLKNRLKFVFYSP